MGKIVHIVLWKLKPQASAEAEAAVKAGIEELKGLKGPESLHIGPPLIDGRTQGFNWGLTSVFASRAALDEYAVSEAHVKVVEEKIKPFVEGVLAYDWEI